MIYSNDNSLGLVTHYSTNFGDRYKKKSICNNRLTHYFHDPRGAGGASFELRLLDEFYSCLAEYPRQLKTFIYLEGRPIGIVHSEVNSGSNAQTDVATYWLHNDHLGTPVLVTTSTRTERWRWENDPFGRSDPIEYQVTGQDVSPDDSPTYGTCGSGSQCSIWSKTYSVTGAKNMRVHFSAFNIDAGTSRTSKDYVRLYQSDGTTTLADLTGNLGDHWSPWSGGSQIKVELFADNQTNSGSGLTIDKLEYATNSRFVMHLRMPGQLWDEDAKASYNYQRWYRREDGRYLSPDRIGLAGGEPGYFGYAAANPARYTDPTGLSHGNGNLLTCAIPLEKGEMLGMDDECACLRYINEHWTSDVASLKCKCLCCVPLRNNGRSGRDALELCSTSETCGERQSDTPEVNAAEVRCGIKPPPPPPPPIVFQPPGPWDVIDQPGILLPLNCGSTRHPILGPLSLFRFHGIEIHNECEPSRA